MEQLNLTVNSKQLIEVDGLQFKDLNGNGKLDPYEDWRLSPQERAEDLVAQMKLDEKVGMMLINQINMGKAKKEGDTSQILDEEFHKADGSPQRPMDQYPTSETIQKLQLRHFILRDNMPARDMAEFINEANKVAEDTRLGIPVIITSNSRNEGSDAVYLNDDHDNFTIYPGTLGIAAATLGDLEAGGGYDIIEGFAEDGHREFNNVGLRKGYMYMADVATDPRWQRTYGTFGEDPELIGNLIERLIVGFQGDQLSSDSVALTLKHFPGGGARENGFDPHYLEGKFNVYRTPGVLEDYHLPPFEQAMKAQPSSVMPYYSAPSIDNSSVQSYKGKEIPFEEVGMAFNHYILQDLLRDELGFEGYVNSDTGIIESTPWGVEDKSHEARFAKAVNAGTDLIGATNDVKSLKKAVERGLISEDRINLANIPLLKEMFALGLFDDKTYVDVDAAEEGGPNEASRQRAYEAHVKSVTLLKNDSSLPLVKEAKIAIETFHKSPEKAAQYKDRALKAAQELGLNLVDDYQEADYVVAFVRPESGDYFNPTPGYLELEIVEDKENLSLSNDTYKETTLSNMYLFNKMADDLHARGGKLITVLNISMPWIVGNIEPQSDVLLATYETDDKAVLEVLLGTYPATGKLPLTLPKNTAVVAVNEHGVCYSRNDVPGYDKDKYLPEGVTYAYVDAAGNEYKLGFGLSS